MDLLFHTWISAVRVYVKRVQGLEIEKARRGPLSSKIQVQMKIHDLSLGIQAQTSAPTLQ